MNAVRLNNTMKRGWKSHKFADVFDLQMGKTPSRDNLSYWNGNNVWVSIADLNDKKYISESKEGITDDAVKESGIKVIPKNTVIMSFKLSIGKTAISTIPLFTNEAIMAFNEKDKSKLIQEYIYYYLKGYKWVGANKAVLGMTLNKKTISEQTFSYPLLDEQEKIVAELDCLSGIIEKKKQELKEYDALAKSIFYEMFGNPIDNEKGWELCTIDSLCSSIVRGPFGSALKKEYFIEPNPTAYKVYEQKHAIQKNADIGTYYISAERFATLSRFEVKAGDIIMSCSGTIGELFEIPISAEKGLMNQALLKFTLNHRIEKIYFLFAMECVKDSFERKGTGLQNIGSVGTIKKTQISLPEITLQQEFASKIEAIEKQKELIKQSIVETETLFNSRMDYYFN